MTPLELINETAKYYSEDPSRRGITIGGHCKYRTAKGQMCAIGRLLTEEGLEVAINCGENINNLLVYRKITGEAFKNKYKGFFNKIILLKSLQEFHDYSLNWDVNGLSENGKIALESLQEKYS